MNNISVLFLFLFILFSTIKCKKDYPSQPATVAEFSFTGKIAGNSIDIESGVNNYYMSTSFQPDANGIYEYTGELKDKNCSANCSNSLKIFFRDYRVYATYPTSIDSLLSPGYFALATPEGRPSKFYTMFSDTLYSGTAQTYLWDFGDGTTSSLHNPPHIYYHPGVYDVTLTTQTGLCSSVISNEIVFGQAGNAFSVPFRENSTTGTTIHYGGGLGGVPPVTWIVDFGDGASTTTTSWTHTYSQPGIFRASLSVTDATGYTSVTHVNAATETEVLCHNDFKLTDTIPVVNPFNFYNAGIEWRDEAGNLFTSVNNNQPETSMFKVISVENFLTNPNGQPTKKIKARISCTLYSGTTDIDLNGEVVFSVAYH